MVTVEALWAFISTSPDGDEGLAATPIGDGRMMLFVTRLEPEARNMLEVMQLFASGPRGAERFCGRFPSLYRFTGREELPARALWRAPAAPHPYFFDCLYAAFSEDPPGVEGLGGVNVGMSPQGLPAAIRLGVLHPFAAGDLARLNSLLTLKGVDALFPRGIRLCKFPVRELIAEVRP